MLRLPGLDGDDEKSSPGAVASVQAALTALQAGQMSLNQVIFLSKSIWERRRTIFLFSAVVSPADGLGRAVSWPLSEPTGGGGGKTTRATTAAATTATTPLLASSRPSSTTATPSSSFSPSPPQPLRPPGHPTGAAAAAAEHPAAPAEPAPAAADCQPGHRIQLGSSLCPSTSAAASTSWACPPAAAGRSAGRRTFIFCSIFFLCKSFSCFAGSSWPSGSPHLPSSSASQPG